MTKNIEWAKEEIEDRRKEYHDMWLEENENEHNEGLLQGKRDGFEEALDIINQLDEPETLSQEWLVEHSYNVHLLGTPDVETVAVPRDDLEGILVPKQEELESKIKVLIEAYKQEDGAYSNPENGWFSGFVEDLENLVEEEQKYYAKIKGWENVTTGSERFNWVYFKEKDTVGVSKAIENKYQTTSFTINEWENLGINDDNADFVLVEELGE